MTGPIEWLTALITLLGVGCVYWSTVAPGLTFWDAGEFIACSHILGIPHPPGTPFFILMGRFMTLLLPFGEVAWRVNMLSALSSVGAAVLGSLIVYRVVRPWMQGLRAADLLALVSGLCAASAMAFASTFWANGTESEVYGASMLFLMLITWLAVVWHEAAGSRGADRLLVIIFYLVFLGIGVHMQNLMLVPPLAIVILMRKGWSFWSSFGICLSVALPLAGIIFMSSAITASIGGISVGAIATPIALMIVVAFVMYSTDSTRNAETIVYWLAVLVSALALSLTSGFLALGTAGLLLATLLLVVTKPRPAPRWLLPFGLFAVIAIGYSTHIYIPIRSHQDPAIDENDPETWEIFARFLERKQYGEESMLERAMTRRGSWQSQFYDNERMGLWSNFRDQYSTDLPVHMIFAFAGALGLLVLLRRSIGLGSLLGMGMLLGSVGLVLYLNFSDGTKMIEGTQMLIKEEVRNRDYFFSPGFVYFALLIGIGVGSLLELISRWLEETPWAAGLPIAAVAIPYLVPLATADLGLMASLGVGLIIVAALLVGLGLVARLLSAHSRVTVLGTLSAIVLCFFFVHQPLAANYGPHDRSRDKIAGDYGHNILASCEEDGLIFTNGDNDTFPLWYLQEVENFRRDVRVINLSLLNTDWYIKQLRDREPKVAISLNDAEIEAMPGRILLRDGRDVRKQDRLIENIVTENGWRKPIYFAITVPEQNRLGLEPHLQMEGFVYRLHREQPEVDVNAERTWELMRDVYRYQGLADETIYKDDNTLNLLNNYIAITYQLATQLRRTGDLALAVEVLEFGLERVTCSRWEIPGTLAQLYLSLERDEDARRVAEEVLEDFGGSTDAIQYVGTIIYSSGHVERAIQVYEQALERWPRADGVFQALFALYYREERLEEAEHTLGRWLAKIPNSSRAQQIRDRVMSAPPPAEE